jgi:hypothetical protein
MPGLDPDSDDKDENNSSESDDDEESGGEYADSGPEEGENIPDLESEDDDKPADEIAKALKGYLDHSEEGNLRYTRLDVSLVQEGDPRLPGPETLPCTNFNAASTARRGVTGTSASSRSRKPWRKGGR